MTNSDYKSGPSLKIADIHTASGEIDDVYNNSETEDVSHPPVRAHPSGQETMIPGTSTPRPDVADYTELNKAMPDDSWSPF